MSAEIANPVWFSVGGLDVRWYGVLVALGFLVATIHWSILGLRSGKRLDYGIDFGFVVMVSGMIGGRIGYVIAHPSRFIEDPVRILRVNEGGLVFYGGLVLALAAVALWARRRGERALSVIDFGMTGVPLGHAIGRIGCFLNGCCYGAPSSTPLALETAGALRHPVQLYEVAFNLALYAALCLQYRRSPKPGSVLALYLILYPAWRLASAPLRGDPQAHWMGLEVVQWVSLSLMAGAGLLMYFVTRNRHEPGRHTG